MPVMDGLEAMRRIRAFGNRWERLPIIGLTASVMADDCRTCLDAGMDEVVAKPLNTASLRNVIKALPLCLMVLQLVVLSCA